MATARLIGILISVARKEGQKDDSDVEEKVPILQVVQVVFNAPTNGCVTTPTIDLSPPRNAYLQAMAIVVAGYFSQELLDEAGTLGPWPNNAHVSFQYIKELRQFIKASLPKECSKSCPP